MSRDAQTYSGAEPRELAGPASPELAVVSLQLAGRRGSWQSSGIKAGGRKWLLDASSEVASCSLFYFVEPCPGFGG